MNPQDRKKAEKLLDEGMGYAAIAAEIGGTTTWMDVCEVAKKTGKWPWRGAMDRISSRHKKIITENDPAKRKILADEIKEYSRRLYDCANNAAQKLASIQKIMEK
jgi:hypothetical protein